MTLKTTLEELEPGDGTTARWTCVGDLLDDAREAHRLQAANTALCNALEASHRERDKLQAAIESKSASLEAALESRERLEARVAELEEACQAVAAHLVTTFPPYPPGQGPWDKVRAALKAAKS